jgi:effector-binding domain-containing protein
MSLNEEPKIVEWSETHYVFVEAVGPFQQNAPKAWQDAHACRKTLLAKNDVTGAMSLYKAKEQIYRAGFVLAKPPVDLPEGLRYEKFEGGKYLCFTLTGSYAQLPRASGRVFELVKERKLPVREGFNIENYVNDPSTTPEAELITEIQFPTV